MSQENFSRPMKLLTGFQEIFSESNNLFQEYIKYHQDTPDVYSYIVRILKLLSAPDLLLLHFNYIPRYSLTDIEKMLDFRKAPLPDKRAIIFNLLNENGRSFSEEEMDQLVKKFEGISMFNYYYPSSIGTKEDLVAYHLDCLYQGFTEGLITPEVFLTIKDIPTCEIIDMFGLEELRKRNISEKEKTELGFEKLALLVSQCGQYANKSVGTKIVFDFSKKNTVANLYRSMAEIFQSRPKGDEIVENVSEVLKSFAK